MYLTVNTVGAARMGGKFKTNIHQNLANTTHTTQHTQNVDTRRWMLVIVWLSYYFDWFLWLFAPQFIKMLMGLCYFIVIIT